MLIQMILFIKKKDKNEIHEEFDEVKYLIKFDNEVGILKFKVSKDQDVVFEKEFQIENEEDVDKAFQEIEDVYRSNGL